MISVALNPKIKTRLSLYIKEFFFKENLSLIECWYDFNNMQNTYITMICTMRYYRWIVNSLRSTRCKKCSSLHIPPDPNETSIRGSIL